MFTVDTSVPATALPKNGPYTATITKAELTSSKVKADGSGGNMMVKLELTVSPTEKSMAEQKQTIPCKVFDYVVFPCAIDGSAKAAADLCKIKANNFIKSANLEGKESSAIAELVGKQIDVSLRQQTDNYGDKMVVVKYIENSLKDAENIPF